MNKFLPIILALLAFSSLASIPYPNFDEIRSLWSLWKNMHQKFYVSSAEENHRFEVFFQNYQIVTHHNSENEDSKLALNQFADMTDEEFRNEVIRGGFLYDESESEDFENEDGDESQIDYGILGLPERWDWREKGAVTAVKNQSKCGSCWAFSATGALEGLYFVTKGALLSFSEQQLVDCEKKSHGCKGGLPVYAFNYTAKNGIELEHDYPYEAKDAECRFSNEKAILVNKGLLGIKRSDPQALKTAAIAYPVSVGVQADQPAFRFYKSGVVKGKCGKKLNHGVLVVGYEKVNGQEAFLVKNSWGEGWGDKGYIRISTHPKANKKAGVCGILLAPSVPTV